MASSKEFPTSAERGKRGSQESRGFSFPADSETNSDVIAQNTRVGKPLNQSGTFHQYERIDLDPLNPVSSGVGQSGDRGASTSPSSGQSETDSLQPPSRKPSGPKKPKDTAAQQKMLGKSGKRGGDAKRGGNSPLLSPPSGADPTVGAKLASHSPERQGMYGYSLAHHDCQIRNSGSAHPSGNPQASRPSSLCKAPVPVPRSKRDTSRPSSSTSLPAVSPTPPPPPATATPPTGQGRVNPQTRPDVIVKQPGKEAPTSSRNSQASGVTANPEVKTEPSTSQKSEKEKNRKAKEADGKPIKEHVDSIPQTNFMIGLLVTFCFNPPLGILAMVISLRAAAAYRDGDKKKGACRARASIIISLVSIMVTMVVVSTLLVYSAVNKHGYGKKDTDKKSSPFGF